MHCSTAPATTAPTTRTTLISPNHFIGVSNKRLEKTTTMVQRREIKRVRNFPTQPNSTNHRERVLENNLAHKPSYIGRQ